MKPEEFLDHNLRIQDCDECGCYDNISKGDALELISLTKKQTLAKVYEIIADQLEQYNERTQEEVLINLVRRLKVEFSGTN